MIGMDFLGFLILLVISVVVSFVLHNLLKFYVVPGFSSFLGKVVIAWLGGWLGSPVFGHWFPGLAYQQIYIIPAILGSLAALILAVDVLRSFAAARGAATSGPMP